MRQRWLRAQGVLCDVVIGVTPPSDGFRAHAWLEDPGQPTGHQPWHELTRLGAAQSVVCLSSGSTIKPAQRDLVLQANATAPPTPARGFE